MGTDVRLADLEDTSCLAETLAQAMHDDPVFAWWVPDDSHRDAVFSELFRLTLTEKYIPPGNVYMTADGAGAAMWAPPDRWRSTDDELGRYGPRMAAALGEYMARAILIQQLIAACHPSEPHYYLQTIGVIPDRQGLGVGSALLNKALERCDREEQGAYLEASNVDSRRLYERHGFVLRDQIRLPDGPSMWPMWRPPAG